jgi:hypothetical protein
MAAPTKRRATIARAAVTATTPAASTRVQSGAATEANLIAVPATMSGTKLATTARAGPTRTAAAPIASTVAASSAVALANAASFTVTGSMCSTAAHTIVPRRPTAYRTQPIAESVGRSQPVLRRASSRAPALVSAMPAHGRARVNEFDGRSEVSSGTTGWTARIAAMAGAPRRVARWYRTATTAVIALTIATYRSSGIALTPNRFTFQAA